MQEVGRCALCGSRERRLFEEYERGGQVFPFVECRECGLAYLAVRPGPEEMPGWYDRRYGQRHRVYRESAFRGRVYAFLRVLLRLRYGGGAPAALVRAAAWPWERKWRRILRTHHLEELEGIGRLLDVGCGKGAWLGAMRRWGFDCHGVDASEDSVRAAGELGLPVHLGMLEDAGFPDRHFDVVRFNHVLEHTFEPGPTLAEALRVLRPGGRLIVAVPNHAGAGMQAFRQSEDVPFHLYGFTPPTLERFVRGAGFSVRRLWTRTPHPQSLYGHFGTRALEMLAGRGEAAREESMRFWSSENPQRRREFAATARYFDAIGHGTEIVVVGIRPGEGE